MDKKHISSGLLSVFLMIILLVSSCGATRPGRMMMMMKRVSPEMVPEHLKQYQPKHQGMVFSQLPKGDHHPPSGPSKGHN
ncbi:hypothetical protein DCAR_0832903 [Daucus carota subsp. sativus]|uniref:Uncharacterized protein n=1 Tax=Daucus carota subsp. sativus TaxID=79200 RepID=A0AAF0XSH6_DAUCS|nr:hypothetical protein DCAR_0832903 [Daucus carota subsp. sativus]